MKEAISKGRREIDALFAELSLPILSNLDVELAIRNEDFDSGQESTDPKYGITWAPLDWLTLRATTGDAFIAPSLQQLFLAEICGISSITDKFGEFSGGVTSCFGGNPNLQNESSESDSIGFDLAFGDFSFSLTWNQTEFVNRIVNTSARQIMAIDFFNFQHATGFAGDGSDNPGQNPSLQQLIDWNNSSAHDPRIIRNPDDILEITQVNTGSSNAESVVVEAFDIQANYRFSLFNWGDFRLNLQATNIASFKYQQEPGGPFIQASGKQNDEAGGTAPALPEWKANLRLSWALGNHAATATVHYIDEVVYDGPQFRFMDRFANTFRRNDVDTITRWIDLDIAYSYRNLQLFDGDGAITVGMRNATDRRAQKTPMFAGVVGELQDPLGRVVYARFNYEF